MATWIISDNIYFRLGTSSLIKDVILSDPLEILESTMDTKVYIRDNSVDKVLIKIGNYQLLEKIIRLLALEDDVRVFIESPSCIEKSAINVCGMIFLNRRLTKYTFVYLFIKKPAGLDALPCVDFENALKGCSMRVLSSFRLGVAGRTLSKKIPISDKNLSYRKIKMSTLMYIKGVNKAVLFRYMDIFFHIYFLRKKII